MNKTYDDEATQYHGVDDEATQYHGADDEATQYETNSTAEQSARNSTSDGDVEDHSSKKSGWKRAVVVAGSGLLIGGISMGLMAMKSADSEVSDGNQDYGNHNDGSANPEWVDDQMHVASSVSDDMSFGEAFAAARAEVGSGGCFEWHGNVYGTYTAEEWNHMSAQERAEFGNHFSWEHLDHSSSDVAQHSAVAHPNHTAQAESTPSDADDIEVVSVNHENDANDMAHHEANTDSYDDSHEDLAMVPDSEPEIEILGVVHDDESGANFGGMSIDGQEVILVDVDGNMEFDYMGSDLNNNAQVDQDEFVDIQDQGFTVDGLGGFTDSADDLLASDDVSDYSSDLYDM